MFERERERGICETEKRDETRDDWAGYLLRCYIFVCMYFFPFQSVDVILSLFSPSTISILTHQLSQMMVDLLASRMAEGDFAALFDISALLDDSALFVSWASRALSLEKSDEAARGFMAACLARGHPTRLREAMIVFEAAGFKEAQEARAKLPQVASTYLAARLADAPPNMPLLLGAILEAEAEGLSSQAVEARAKLPRLVQT